MARAHGFYPIIPAKSFTKETIDQGFNPFYGIMPESFKIIGLVIATVAAIIASQALISGSFTLISESMRLNLWPKMKINYPTEERGQLFIPGHKYRFAYWVLRELLFILKPHQIWKRHMDLPLRYVCLQPLCCLPIFLFRRRTSKAFIYLYLFVYLTIELGFLFANLDKFPHGGFVTLIVGGALFSIMYVWFRARKVKNRYVEFVRLEQYLPTIQELSNDHTIPKYATHLVYLTSANNPKEIEHKIIYSILNRKPKRADILLVCTCGYTG